MNPLTVVALSVAGLFAVGDWVSRAGDRSSPTRRRLEYVCKPATMVALVVAAAALDPAAGADARRQWFVAALVFSLAGDVLLMLPREQFVGGLSAFLVGHVCYLAGFWTHGPSALALAVSTVGVVVVVGAVGSRVLPAARRRDPALLAPVAVYMVVIAAMLATALAVGNAMAGVGAALFVASDSLIAWDRFVLAPPSGTDTPQAPRATPRATPGVIPVVIPVVIMVTYHLGQAGLVLSLLR